MHLAENMLQRLGVELVLHLGQLRALGGGQLALGTEQGAGVVLHAQEVIVPDIGQIVAELLVPLRRSGGLAPLCRLAVVHGEGDAHLHIGVQGLDGRLGRLVGPEHQNVALRSAGGDEDLGLGRAEHLGVLHGSVLHVLHHFLEVHAHLDGALGALGLGRLLGHQHIPLGDGGQLQAHVGLIDGADIAQLAAQFFRYISGVAAEVFDGALRLPAALADEPRRGGEVVEGDDGLYAICLAAGDDLAVMLDLRLVKLALLRLDAGPLNGEAVGVEPRPGQQYNVLLIAVIVVASQPAGLGKAGVGQQLLGPVVAVDIVALHLMGRRGGADEKSLGKSHVLPSL